MARVRDERPCEFEREERGLVKLSDGERERERERDERPCRVNERES